MPPPPGDLQWKRTSVKPKKSLDCWHQGMRPRQPLGMRISVVAPYPDWLLHSSSPGARLEPKTHGRQHSTWLLQPQPKLLEPDPKGQSNPRTNKYTNKIKLTCAPEPCSRANYMVLVPFMKVHWSSESMRKYVKLLSRLEGPIKQICSQFMEQLACLQPKSCCNGITGPNQKMMTCCLRLICRIATHLQDSEHIMG